MSLRALLERRSPRCVVSVVLVDGTAVLFAPGGVLKLGGPGPFKRDERALAALERDVLSGRAAVLFCSVRRAGRVFDLDADARMFRSSAAFEAVAARRVGRFSGWEVEVEPVRAKPVRASVERDGLQPSLF